MARTATSTATKKAAPKTKNVSSEGVLLDSRLTIAERLQQAIDNEFTNMGIAIPSWKRTALAFIASCLAAVGLGYLIGQALSYLMIGAFAVTGSMFLSYVIMIVGAVLAFYAGMKIGQRVSMYILTGDIDRDIVRVKNAVSGWFGREPAAA